MQEITVEDDPRNLVWRNLTLIRADSPEKAYDKSLLLGRDGETEYNNPDGKRVTIRFRGLSLLDVIHDELKHDAEILFHSEQSVSENEIAALVKNRDELQVFQPSRPLAGPDVASAEIIDEVEKRFGISRPGRR